MFGKRGDAQTGAQNVGRESTQFMTDWVDSRPAFCGIFDVVQTFVVAGLGLTG